MNKIVIYTAIFGDRDKLIKPDFIPKDVDFICFTNKNFKIKPWQIRKVKIDKDARRTARKYKILPHKYLSDYEVSIWVDGNIIIRGDVKEAVNHYLVNQNIAIYDHSFTIGDARDCVYKEVEMMKSSKKAGQEELIKAQIKKYREDGYPENNGLISSMIIFRRHNKSDVIQHSEKWWDELSNFSNRDQLSFNYSAWKTGLKYFNIQEDSRNNKYFYQVEHNLNFKQRLINYLRKIK